jgi:hypothetical protein
VYCIDSIPITFDEWYLSSKGVLCRYRRRQRLSLRPHPLNVIIIIIMDTAPRGHVVYMAAYTMTTGTPLEGALETRC